MILSGLTNKAALRTVIEAGCHLIRISKPSKQNTTMLQAKSSKVKTADPKPHQPPKTHIHAPLFDELRLPIANIGPKSVKRVLWGSRGWGLE